MMLAIVDDWRSVATIGDGAVGYIRRSADHAGLPVAIRPAARESAITVAWAAGLGRR